MTVKNYYTFTEEERDAVLNNVREWLFENPKHADRKRVEHALDVILDAKNLQRDEFTQWVIDNLA